MMLSALNFMALKFVVLRRTSKEGTSVVRIKTLTLPKIVNVLHRQIDRMAQRGLAIS
jgi:hypothetical protein